MTGERESRGERKQLCIVRHDSKKFLLIDLAVLVQVKLVYHRLSDRQRQTGTHNKRGRKKTDVQLIVLEPVPNLFGNAPEVAYGYLARVIIIEQLERAPNLLHRITRQNPFRH